MILYEFNKDFCSMNSIRMLKLNWNLDRSIEFLSINVGKNLILTGIFMFLTVDSSVLHFHYKYITNYHHTRNNFFFFNFFSRSIMISIEQQLFHLLLTNKHICYKFLKENKNRSNISPVYISTIFPRSINDTFEFLGKDK